MKARLASTRIVIRLSALGDLVLTSALARRLRQEHPADRLLVLTSAPFEAFVAGSFAEGCEVLPLFLKGPSPLKWFLAGICAGSEVLQRGETVSDIYECHGVLKSRLLLWGLRLRFALAGQFVSIKKSPKKAFFRRLSILLGRDLLGPRHIFREQVALSGNNSLTDTGPFLRAPGIERKAHALLVAPDASYWKKRWPTEYWETLLKRILEERNSVSLTLVGSKDCLPESLVQNLERQAPGRIHNLLGKTRLEDLPSIAAAHALTLCGNSAWLHISEAVGTPVLTLAGPIVPGFGFSPWRKDSVELSVALPCRPCSSHGQGRCRLSGADYHACMKRLAPDEVMGILSSRLP